MHKHRIDDRTTGSKGRTWRRVGLGALVLVSQVPLAALGGTARDNRYLDLSLEDLLAIEIPRVSAASGYEQSATEAPSAITTIGAEDIRRHGYRTLAEALSGERGFYVTDNQNYQFLGMRGFNQPGDYNSRFLLLIDGMRLNDPLYGMAPIGEDFPLDLDLVDRVEIIRGPGSSLYGSGAVLGVVNVITRRGGSIAGTRLHASTGSLGARAGGVSHGTTTEAGTELVLSASGMRARGQDPLVFPELAGNAAANGGIAVDGDRERARRLYLAVTHGDLRFSLIDGARDKRYASGLYGTVFGDNRGFSRDARQFLDLQYRHALDGDRSVGLRLYRGSYRYGADYVYDYPPLAINRDDQSATWWGTEVRYDHPWRSHHFSIGGEVVTTGHNQLVNFDRNTDGSFAGCRPVASADACVDRRVPGGSSAVFLQDDVAFAPGWRATGVLRHDWVRGIDGVTSPRFGLIHTPREGTALKAIYGQSFRAPSLYERYSAYPPSAIDSPGLRSERVRAWELIAEHSFLPNLRGLASLFQYHVHALAQDQTDAGTGLLYNANTEGFRSRGVELELQWREDWLDLRGSWAGYDTVRDSTGMQPSGSPAHMEKLRLGVPLRDDRLYAGIDLQHVGGTMDVHGHPAPGHTLANLVFTSRGVVPRLDVSLGIYNLLDRRYGDPANTSSGTGVEFTPRPGRTFRLKLDYLL